MGCAGLAPASHDKQDARAALGGLHQHRLNVN